MIVDLVLRYFFQGFAYGFFDDGEGLWVFIHIIERDLIVLLAQEVLM